MKSTLHIKHPKRLGSEDWNSLKGTPLWGEMFRNRQVIDMPLGAEVRDAIPWGICEWLDEFCNSFWHVPIITNGTMTVYIESDADAVNFKMFFEGKSARDFEIAMKQMKEIANTRFPLFDQYAPEEMAQKAMDKVRRKLLYGDVA